MSLLCIQQLCHLQCNNCQLCSSEMLFSKSLPGQHKYYIVMLQLEAAAVCIEETASWSAVALYKADSIR